jgi:hypothetical protein
MVTAAVIVAAGLRRMIRSDGSGQRRAEMGLAIFIIQLLKEYFSQ